MRMRPGPKGFTLLEVIVSAALLAIVLLGVGSSFSALQRSQWMDREAQAANIAAADKLDEVASFRYLNPDSSLYDQYHGTGFRVLLGVSEMGSDTGSGVNTFKPGADSLYPNSRVGAVPAIKAMAGYVEVMGVEDPAAPGTFQADLHQVTVTIAWRTYGGDRKVTFAQIVGKQ